MRDSWYVSEAENSKGNFILGSVDPATGKTNRDVVSRATYGELDLDDPKTVPSLDKIVSSNIGTTVVNADGSTTTYYGFGASTRKYAKVASKLQGKTLKSKLQQTSLMEIHREYVEPELD